MLDDAAETFHGKNIKTNEKVVALVQLASFVVALLHVEALKHILKHISALRFIDDIGGISYSKCLRDVRALRKIFIVSAHGRHVGYELAETKIKI